MGPRTNIGDRGQSSTSRTQGRVYTLTAQEAQASNAVVTGTLLVGSMHARVLFDSGTTHSFISPYFETHLGGDIKPLGTPIVVATPT